MGRLAWGHGEVGASDSCLRSERASVDVSFLLSVYCFSLCYFRVAGKSSVYNSVALRNYKLLTVIRGLVGDWSLEIVKIPGAPGMRNWGREDGKPIAANPNSNGERGREHQWVKPSR